MPPRTRRFNLNLIAALHDAIMAACSFILALYLRLGLEGLPQIEKYTHTGVLLFTAICVAMFTCMKLYRGLWRYASLQDMLAITKAVTLSVLVFASAMFFISRLEGMPRSVL